jgi:hypothetical protein
MHPERTYSKEFEQVKQLAGMWKGSMRHSDGKSEPTTTEYRVVAAGSAVEERLMAGTPHEMIDMYTDQGGRLTMVHYCAIGNQPNLQLKSATPKQMVFEMGPTPGIDPMKDMHMHALTLEFPDANRMIQTWSSWSGGKPNESSVATFTRVK